MSQILPSLKIEIEFDPTDLGRQVKFSVCILPAAGELTHQHS